MAKRTHWSNIGQIARPEEQDLAQDVQAEEIDDMLIVRRNSHCHTGRERVTSKRLHEVRMGRMHTQRKPGQTGDLCTRVCKI